MAKDIKVFFCNIISSVQHLALSHPAHPASALAVVYQRLLGIEGIAQGFIYHSQPPEHLAG